VYGDNWSALFYHVEIFPLPPELEAGTYHVHGGGYDGQFYRLLAHDPLLQEGYAQYADAPQLRFRRILVPFSELLTSGKLK
jgi:hypothetical protein